MYLSTRLSVQPAFYQYTHLKIKHKYRFFFLAFWLCSNLVAQEDQIVVKRVPFTNNGTAIITNIIQDTTGLIWLMGQKGLFISDGEKVLPIPLLNEQIKNKKIKGLYQGTPDGNMYLGGDSMRIFNPFNHRIFPEIGSDAKYNSDGKNPVILSFLESADSLIWTILTSHGINANDELVPGGNAILLSKNGKPFQKVVSNDFFFI